MSDINSSLPVRTQANGDVVVFLADGTTPSQVAAVDSHGSQATLIKDASGNAVTTQANGAQRALDVGINVAGVQIDPRSIRALTAADVVTANQGTANTAANGWFIKVTDGTNTAAVKAASTAAVAADPSLVVALSPNSPLPAGTNLLGSINQGTSPWITKDQADGPVSPGTVASFSQLIGGQYNSVLPTLTTGQQSAIQVDSSGRLLVSGSFTLSNDTNYGTVGANTLRTASQIGNATGAADFNAGATGAQTLRTVANQGAPNTAANAWFIKNSDGTNTAAVKAASTPAAATDPALVVALSPNSPVPAGTNLIGAVNLDLGGTPVGPTNPIPVTLADSIGTSVDSYNTAASVAGGATSNADYTVTAAKTFYGRQIWATSSGKLKIEVQFETAAGSGTFNTFWVGFNSTADPNILIPITKTQVAGARIRIIRTNKDLLAQDVYTTLSGTEQ